jgi:hypothetical protein
MGRNRLPDNVVELNGGKQANPKRWKDQGRDTAPKDERALGPAGNVYGMIDYTEAWDMIVDQCAAGVLKRRDRQMVGMAAALLMDTTNMRAMVMATGGQAIMSNAYLKALAQLAQILSRLGMSPVDASKVAGTAAPAKNDFDD